MMPDMPMIRLIPLLPLTLLLAPFAAPQHAPSAARPASALGHYNPDAKSPATARLPGELKEISGLAVSREGGIFCHDDERGVVYRIDPGKGRILGSFSVGERTFRKDFEGIAIADSLMYLVTSDGAIHEFREAVAGGRADVRVYPTGLGAGWDVEGLCYDPPTRALLLACKENPLGKELRHVYSFSLKTRRLDSIPRFVIDVERLRRDWKIDGFRPSAIERHPSTGTFFVLSSAGPAIVELSPSGTVVAAARLHGTVHPQPEGLTFGADLTMYISNEGKGHGVVVRYPYTR